MARSAGLHDALAGPFPAQAPYAVALAYRVRYSIEMNAREAMHMIELRTAPAGHPEYRRVCQEMHRLIAEEAGHRHGRRHDALRRPRCLRPGTTRRRAPGRGPPPGPGQALAARRPTLNDWFRQKFLGL